MVKGSRATIEEVLQDLRQHAHDLTGAAEERSVSGGGATAEKPADNSADITITTRRRGPQVVMAMCSLLEGRGAGRIIR